MYFVKIVVLVMTIVGHAVATGKGTGSSATNYGSSSVNYGGTSSTSIGGGSSVNYGGGSSFTSTGFSGSTSSVGFSGGSSTRFGQNEVPQPYNFDYQTADEQGNSHFRREESDASGTVRGSYGYTDIQGLYRVVDYIADASGFRASIRTNEPGTDGKISPADVQMTVEEPPAGIQDGYTSFSGTGGFRGTGGSKTRGGYSAVGQTYTSGIDSKGVEGIVAPYSGTGGGVKSGKSGY